MAQLAGDQNSSEEQAPAVGSGSGGEHVVNVDEKDIVVNVNNEDLKVKDESKAHGEWAVSGYRIIVAGIFYYVLVLIERGVTGRSLSS